MVLVAGLVFAVSGSSASPVQAAGSQAVAVDWDWGRLPGGLKQANWDAPAGVARQVTTLDENGNTITYWVAGNEAGVPGGGKPAGSVEPSPRLGGSHEFDWGPWHVTGVEPFLHGRVFRVAFLTSRRVPTKNTDIGWYLNVVRSDARAAGLPAPDEWGVWLCSEGRSVADNIGNWGPGRNFFNGYEVDGDGDMPLYWLNGTEITNSFGNPSDMRDLVASEQLAGFVGGVKNRNGRDDARFYNNFGGSYWNGCVFSELSRKITATTTSELGNRFVDTTNPVTGYSAPSNNNYSGEYGRLLAVSPPLVVSAPGVQVAVAGSASGPAAGLAGDSVMSVAGGGRAVYELKLASAPEGAVSVTATADGPVKLSAGDVADTPANRMAAGSSATVAWDQNNWNQTRTVTVFASANAGYRDMRFSISHRFSEGFADKYVLMTEPTGTGNSRARLKGLGFLDARFGIDGVVPGLPEPTEDLAIVLDPVAPSFTNMAPNANRSFTVKLSRAPDEWSETVYVSPVDDLSQTQARCKVAHPDWACRTKGQLIFNSSGDAVYEWSFSESPLTLRVGNAACGTSNRVLQEQLFAARRCSKPKSRPYVALTFTQANWDTAKQVTLTRTGNSFRSYADRTGSLYVSFVHPWQLRTNSRTDSRTKTIGVSLNTSRVLNSPSQEIIFHGIEDQGGQPKQMSDSEYQALQQQQQEQQSDTSALEADIQERVESTARNGDGWSNRIWRGALAAVQGADPDADAREVDAAFAKRLADNHRSAGRTELADLWQTIADTLNSPPPPPTPVPTPTPLPTPTPTPTPTPVPTPTPTPTPVPTPTPTPTPTPVPTPVPTPTPTPPPVEAGSLDCDNSGVTVDEITVAEPSAMFATAAFKIELCGDNWGNTLIDYHFEHITTNDADFYYFPTGGTLVLKPFQTTTEIRVMIGRDTKAEGDETFALILDNAYSYRPINLGTGRIKATITDTG